LRLFLAINLSLDVRRNACVAVAPLREIAPHLAWVAEPRLHLTLKFLGEQPEDRVPQIRDALAAIAAQHRELAMSLGGISAFPNFRRARVLWMSVAPEPRLELLHHEVELSCESLGFEIDGRPYRPHVTLARMKQPLAEEAARLLSRAAKRTNFHAEFTIRSVDLMLSHQSGGGPAYTSLASAALAPG
jgi:2'-5' RNA ligase